MFFLKKRVLIRAPLLTISGYGVHARQIFEWAISRSDFDVYVQPLQWGVTPWLINPDSKDGIVGEIMKRVVDPAKESKFDITFQVQLPNEWDPNLGKFNVGITAAVETDICHKDWIHACNRMDAIIVPSTHTKNVLLNSGETLNKPLFVVPEAFHSSISQQDVTNIDLDFTTDFNFLVFGQITGNNPENDRKNLFYTIKWICEEFKNDKNVGLVIKTNSGRATKIDKAMTTRLIRNLLTEIRGKSVFPKTYLLHGNMSENEVAGLYRNNKIKALVSLTRGEGFGLPLLEAAASGLPVIATAWSGHTDFLNHGKYVSIDPKLTPVHKSRIDGKIFIQGSKWAEVSESEVKQKLRKFYEKPSMPQQWANELSTVIKQKYSIEAIKTHLDSVLSELKC